MYVTFAIAVVDWLNIKEVVDGALSVNVYMSYYAADGHPTWSKNDVD